MAPRPYWKGYLKLSLVACPIVGVHGHHELRAGVVPADQQEDRQPPAPTVGRRRDARGGRGGRQRPRLRGRQGVYIQVDDDEIEALEIESNHTIDIDSFVPRTQIDERYHDSSYYIAPSDQVGREAFAVIREAMRGKDMVALGPSCSPSASG